MQSNSKDILLFFTHKLKNFYIHKSVNHQALHVGFDRIERLGSCRQPVNAIELIGWWWMLRTATKNQFSHCIAELLSVELLSIIHKNY